MQQVLARQADQPHVLDGRCLTVTVFQGLLQDLHDDLAGDVSSSPLHHRSEQTKATQQPKQATTQQFHLAVDPDVMEFIHKSSHLDLLKMLLQGKNCALEWNSASKHAFILYDGYPKGNCYPSLCIQEVQSFLDMFEKWDIPIEEDTWNSLETGSMDTVCDCLADDPPLVRSFTDDSGFYLRVVSLRAEKESYDEILQERLAEIYRLERRRNYRMEKINVSEERIQLLRKTNFEQKLQQEFGDLTVKIDDENDEILFEGPEDEVTDAITRYCMQEAEITEKQLQLSHNVLEVLNTDAALQAVKAQMAANEVEAVFVLEEDESASRVVAAKVLGISRDQAKKASDLINRLTAETVLKIDKQDVGLTTTPEWDQISDEVMKDGTVVIRRDETGRTWVAGLSRDVASSVKKLTLFLKENAVKISTKKFSCPTKDIKRYLREYGENDLINIEKRLDKYDVKILDGRDGDSFVISGQEEGLNHARLTLDLLIQGLVTKKLKLKQAGLGKFCSGGKADNVVEKIEKDQKCVIRVEKIFAKMKDDRSTRSMTTAATMESDSTESEDEEVIEDNSAVSFVQPNSASFCVTTQGHNISWKAGNIAQEKVSSRLMPLTARRFRAHRYIF